MITLLFYLLFPLFDIHNTYTVDEGVKTIVSFFGFSFDIHDLYLFTIRVNVKKAKIV